MATETENTSSVMTGLKEMLKRQEDESIINRKNKVTWDESKQFVYVVDGKIALRAVEDKIIVLLDKFRTGYECKICGGDGLGRLCAACRETPGYDRFGQVCRYCNGKPDIALGGDCLACKGRGSLVVVPESSKALPTSGIIVSVGPKCEYRRVGDRILFGAHVGYFLPFKGNVRLRTMREYEPLADIFMLDASDDSVLQDFIQIDEAIDNRGDL